MTLSNLRKISACPHCGAPIYDGSDGAADFPTPRYTCSCRLSAPTTYTVSAGCHHCYCIYDTNSTCAQVRCCKCGAVKPLTNGTTTFTWITS